MGNSDKNDIALTTTNNENVIQAASSTVVASIATTGSRVALPVQKVIMIQFLTAVVYSDVESGGVEATLPEGTVIHCAGVDNIYLKTSVASPVIALLFKGY